MLSIGYRPWSHGHHLIRGATMRFRLSKVVMAAIAGGTLAIGATGMASASTSPTPSINAPSVDPTSGIVGTGWTDLSTITIVGTIDPKTGKVTDTPPHPLSTPSGTGVIQPMITNPPCNGRTDFYRIIDSSGYTRCFANSGTWTLADSYWTNITTLCPGNNRGRTEWLNGVTNTWSVWRGPESNYNYCYSFSSPVPAFAVQIS